MSMDSVDREMSVEQQLAALREQLVQAQKLTALGELVSTTTHEFNNVLMTVINYAKMGLRATDDASRTKAFERILSAGQRAAKITSTILGVARNRGSSFEPTDLAALINDTLVLLERELRNYRINVECQFETANLPRAMVSGNQIQQVLINLLVNARQAMTNGGRVIIGLTYDSQRDTVNLEVRDNGPGIAPETLPRIFDPFFSTKQGPDSSGKGGTGLGLSACKEIIEAHRGRIRVESTVGRGTSFTLMLPAAKTAAPVALPGVPTDTTAPSAAN